MNALTNFLTERQKPTYNPKILVDFPFNNQYKVNQMKHNLFQSQKVHRISECKKKIIIIIMQSTKAKCLNEPKKLPSHNMNKKKKMGRVYNLSKIVPKKWLFFAK